MKQNPICEETRRHRSLDEHENFTSSQLFWANKPAVVPEKLLFPLILRSTRTFLTHTYIFKLFLTLTFACCSYWIECVFFERIFKEYHIDFMISHKLCWRQKYLPTSFVHILWMAGLKSGKRKFGLGSHIVNKVEHMIWWRKKLQRWVS